MMNAQCAHVKESFGFHLEFTRLGQTGQRGSGIPVGQTHIDT